MAETLGLIDLTRINENLGKMKMQEIITRVYNETCETGLEVRYIGDSRWEFVNPAEAQETLDTIWQKDAKRCGLDT